VRTFLIFLLALSTGALASYEYWRLNHSDTPDPVEVIVTQMKTHAVIEHQRQVAVWYRACPSVWGVSPQIFIAWPAHLTYQIELGDIQVNRNGGVISVRTSAIHAVDPSVPTDHMDYMAAISMLSIANQHELINQEIAKATPVARYLSTYFLMHDVSLQEDFREELQSLVEHFTASLGVPVTRVDVEIPKVEVSSLPPLPRIELCSNSTASVNGLPFAKFNMGSTVPIAFEILRHMPGRETPSPTAGSSASAPVAGARSTGTAAPGAGAPAQRGASEPR
jgi:hypothetical protein